MQAPLELLLSQEPRPNDAALERVLAAAREELARNRPVRCWRTEAGWVFAASVAMAGGVAAVLLALGQVAPSVLLGRAPLLALLWGTGAVCAWGALSPRGRGLRWGGGVMAVASAAALVVARGPVLVESTLPEWVCTVSHVAVAVVPLTVALLLLRNAAFHPWRALVAGLCVGTTGAFLGELACAQGGLHVALYHLSAWALVAVAALAVSKSLQPRSFAP